MWNSNKLKHRIEIVLLKVGALAGWGWQEESKSIFLPCASEAALAPNPSLYLLMFLDLLGAECSCEGAVILFPSLVP